MGNTFFGVGLFGSWFLIYTLFALPSHNEWTYSGQRLHIMSNMRSPPIPIFTESSRLWFQQHGAKCPTANETIHLLKDLLVSTFSRVLALWRGLQDRGI